MSEERKASDLEAAYYRRCVTGISGRLRDLADEFERKSRPYDDASFDGTPRWSNAVGNALHTLTWGIANLNSADLVNVFTGEAKTGAPQR